MAAIRSAIHLSPLYRFPEPPLGGTTAEACWRIAVSEQTYYRWRKEYGGLKTDQARPMKDLEKENLRLRRAISDLTLDKLILQEAARGNF